MSGIVCLYSYRFPNSEKLKGALSWLYPPFSKEPNLSRHSHQHNNIGIGVVGKDTPFYSNKEQTRFVAFAGTLIRKEKLCTLLELQYDRSISDAELILRAYEKMGIEFLKELDGYFVFQILDVETKQLFIVRDRVGQYPLYWTSTSQGLIFASSLKAILATGLVSPNPDLQSIAAYLFLGYISQDDTPIQGINRLLPGYYIKLTFEGKLSIHSYWSFSSCFTKDAHQSFDETHHKLDQTICEAFQERNSVPSLGWATSTDSEGSRVVKNLASEYGLEKSFSQSVDIAMTPQSFIDSLVPMVWSIETPIAALDALFSWQFVQKSTHRGCVPLFDTGFQQEFCEYSANDVTTYVQNGMHNWKNVFAKIGAFLFPKLAIKLLRIKLEHDTRLEFIRAQALLSESQVRHAAPSFGSYFHLDFFIHEFYNLPKITSANASLFYLNFKTYVVDSLNESRARIALHHGFEAYSPFLDLRLLEYLASLDDAIWQSSDFLSLYPNRVLSKQEPAPNRLCNFHQWFSHPGFSKIFDALVSGYLVKSGFISGKWIQRLLRNKEIIPFEVLYAVLILELWMRLFIDRPISKMGYETPIQDLLYIPKK